MSMWRRCVPPSKQKASPGEAYAIEDVAKSRVSQVLCIGVDGPVRLVYLILDHERTAVARAEQLAYLPKGDYLKLAVLGYRQVVADLIWLQVVQHIGAKRDTQLGYTWTYHAVDVDGPGSHLRSPISGLLVSSSVC